MTEIAECLAAAGIEVKPLVWEPTHMDTLVARTFDGKYTICKPWFTGRGLFWLRGVLDKNCDTLEAAKAAAQADHDARICAQLEVMG